MTKSILIETCRCKLCTIKTLRAPYLRYAGSTGMIKYNLQVTYITKAKANNGTELEMCNNNLLTLDMYQAHWAITELKILKI